MKFANKEFLYYWKIIKVPTYVLIGWSVIGFILAAISFPLYMSIFSAGVSWLLMIAVFGFIGWTAIKDHKQTIKIAAWSGALAGAVAGFAGGIISILMFYFVPSITLYAASQAGVDPLAVQGVMKIAIYIGLITGPLFSALIGAAISAIAALIAKKV
ncbi:MAG: hypothetical protein V1831_01295 [Candidatus Woesearchaeota archaeon]